MTRACDICHFLKSTYDIGGPIKDPSIMYFIRFWKGLLVRRLWVHFQLQGSEMSENISLKMGVKFAASLNMSKNLC